MLAFAEHELGPLLHDDRCGTDLVAVLAAFLDSGGDKAGAARRCGIARPALDERLSQVQQVLGANLGDAGRRTTLHAVLLIRQLGSDQSRMKLRRALRAWPLAWPRPNRHRG